MKRKWQKRKAKLKSLKATTQEAAPPPPPQEKTKKRRKRPLAADGTRAAGPKRSMPPQQRRDTPPHHPPLPMPSLVVPAFEPPRWEIAYDAAAVERCVQPLLAEPAVGIDIEWRPTFVAGRAPNPVALLQLSSRSRCVLVPVHHLRKPLPPSIGALLASPRIWKLGCGVGDDAKKLLADCGLACTPTLEVGEVAVRLQREEGVAFPGLADGEAVRPGLKNLSLACGFDLEKPKKLSRSNWEKRPLTPEQQRYAAYDAYAGVWIARCLHVLHAKRRAAQAAAADDLSDVGFSRWLAQQAALNGAFHDRQASARAVEKKANKQASAAAKAAEKQAAVRAQQQQPPPPPTPDLEGTMARVVSLFRLPADLPYTEVLRSAERKVFGAEQAGRLLERATRLLEA